VPNRNVVPESFVLREIAQIKALADPLRQRLLREFAQSPQTTKQVANTLKENPTKLYHHVETLAQAGLLKLVRTQQKRGTTERYYQAAGKQFAVHRNIFRHLSRRRISGSEKIGPHAVFESAFTSALAEIKESVDGATQDRSALLQARICATPPEAVALRKKIQQLIQIYTRARRIRNTGRTTSKFELLFAIYPVRSRPRQKKADSTRTKQSNT
jgi:DNA-binding transcriptional ArsR family regulator